MTFHMTKCPAHRSSHRLLATSVVMSVMIFSIKPKQRQMQLQLQPLKGLVLAIAEYLGDTRSYSFAIQ